MMDFQTIAAAVIVACAALFLLRFALARRGCGSGCGKCDEVDSTDRKSLPMA